MIIAAILILIIITAIIIAAYRRQCLLRDRARLMRDAMRHRDFSFKLPTNGLLFGERALQEALNAMGEDIQKVVARNEIESWKKLTRVLTHEIMNATTPIQSISQAYLSHPGIKNSPYEEGIRAIHDTSLSLAAFVDSYRKLTQMQEPTMRETNLLHFCKSVASLYPQLHWQIDVDASITISIDESLMRQVFINLMKNAIEAGAANIGIRHIAPSAYKQHGSCAFHQLLISNDGSAMTDDVAREIFIPFFTTKLSGSGIGLSVSRQILMMQRLSLTLRRKPEPGYNVTFEIANDQ